MTEKELLLTALKFVGLDAESAEKLYSDGQLVTDAKAQIEAAIKAKADKIKADLTAKYDAGHNKAKAEVLSKKEEEIRKKYGIDDDDLEGEKLIDAVIQKHSKVDTETIKSNPEFVKISTELKNLQKKANELDKVKADYEAIKSKYTTTTLRQQFNNVFGTLKPILSKDAGKAAKQAEDLFNVISKNKIMFDDTGKPILLDADGNTLQDENGNEITFEALVKAETEARFDFDSTPQRQSAGQPNGQRANGVETVIKGITISKPKNADDYYAQKDKIVNSDLTKEEKNKLLDNLQALDIGS